MMMDALGTLCVSPHKKDYGEQQEQYYISNGIFQAFSY
jgi:hypothetical protein